jgi:pimeloyl-ACP methyl ester carboxylesterase
MPATPSRRSLLVAAGGLLVAGPASGCSGDSTPSGRRPSGVAGSSATRGPRLLSGRFRSDAMGGRSVGWTVCLPPGVRAAGLPVCVVLHGRGDTHRAAFTFVGLQHQLGAAAAGRPFALASVDGGADSYYHARSDGTDAQAMVTAEYLPVLAHLGLRTDRFALFGWSMGGYGALLLAEHLGSARVAAVAVDSPALWLHSGDSAAGAFDDAEDFARNDVFDRRDRLARIPVRVVVGRRDPFLTATRAFVTGVPDLATAVVRDGGHDAAFWRATAPAQLAFVAAALNR